MASLLKCQGLIQPPPGILRVKVAVAKCYPELQLFVCLFVYFVFSCSLGGSKTGFPRVFPGPGSDDAFWVPARLGLGPRADGAFPCGSFGFPRQGFPVAGVSSVFAAPLWGLPRQEGGGAFPFWVSPGY